jgi:FkbM family methyltransferase
LTKADLILVLIKLFGIKSTIRIVVSRILKFRGVVTVEYEGNRFGVRPCESDTHVAYQIFWKREYDIPLVQKEAINRTCKDLKSRNIQPIIIDAGANVGYASIYLANEFPDARIISIEPDPDTFDMLRHNCRGLENVFPVHGALWKHNQGVTLDNMDVPCWGRTVKDDGKIPSFTLEEIIKTNFKSQIVLLKLDIEGAEYDVFNSSHEIIKYIPCIIVEPHDWLIPGHSSLSPLFRSISGRAIDTIINGENLVLFDTGLYDPQVIAAETAA